MQVKNIKNKIFSPDFLKQLASFFVYRVKLFLFMLFLFLAGYCFYLWYVYIYDLRWSENKTNEYINANNKDVTFDMNKFNVIIEKKQKRESDYQKEIKDVPDIFRLKNK